MKTKKIKTSEVYFKTLKAYEDNYKIICHQGGSRSSKTWSIFQFFLIKALEGNCWTLTIARDALSWIRATLLVDFRDMLELYEIPVSPAINFNRSDQVYNVNGTEFGFFGTDYPQKLHGRSQDWFWLNEAMEIEKTHFDQLEMRTRIGGMLDYNPYDDSHWVLGLTKREDVKQINSTQLDNPFLPDTIRNTIKGYEPTEENIEAGTADNYLWEVYGLGKPAKLKGVIFKNWEEVEKIPRNAKFVGYGQDFGFTNDPTTVIAMYQYNKDIYFDEILYSTNLTNQDLVSKYKENGIGKNEKIIADSAEPKSIEEIKRKGYSIKGSKKGRDSIRYGIDILKSHKFYITQRSIHIKEELRKYKWKEDKAGEATQDPIDKFNHCIDAMRYIAMDVLGSRYKVRMHDRHF